MTSTAPVSLIEKFKSSTMEEYLLYAAELREFLQDPDLNRLLALPPLPFGVSHPFLTSLCGAGHWGTEEEGAVRFFCHLAKLHSTSVDVEKYAKPLIEIVAMSRKLDLEGSISNGDEIIRVMVETGFTPPEIAGIYNTRRWGEGRFVPLAFSIRSPDAEETRQIPVDLATAQTRAEQGISENRPAGGDALDPPPIRKESLPTTAIERYILSLPDEALPPVLDAIQGHTHILESLAAHRLTAARAWLSVRNLHSVDAGQIKALIRGSSAFDPNAVSYAKTAKEPSAAAMVVWQLSQLRPDEHRDLRDEFYQKPEIAMDVDVMKDLVTMNPKKAIALLREGLERRLYKNHPDTEPYCYHPAYTVAATLWDEESKQMFASLLKTRSDNGIVVALQQLVKCAPSDADEVFDELLAQLCFSKAAMGWSTSMLELVASKRPGRMLDGWWKLLDRGFMEESLMAARALAAGLGIKAIPGIEERLAHKEAGIRFGAVAVLSEVGGEPSVQILQEALGEERNDMIRDAIYDALNRHGTLPIVNQVVPAEAASVLAGIEAGFAKKMVKAKMPPGVWWKVSDSSGLNSLDGSPLSRKSYEYLVFEHARLKTVKSAPDTLQLIACLDKRSGADFALALLNAWLAEGQDSKHRWVLALAGTLGDSRIISTLLPWIPKWCEAARYKLAEYAAQGISLLGSNEALMVLDTLASRYRSKFRNVGAAAAAAFQSAAQARGISPDELGDLVVPSFDFNEDGQRRFDWDGGAALAELTMDLKLEWSDPDSEKSWKALPASAPEAVKAEVTELGKLLRETGKAQALRLEQALVKQRRWPVAAWQELYEKHPLLRAYATRLVWGVYDAAGSFQRAFRRYPNGILADAAGAMEELPEGDARIGLLHPLDLDDTALTAWQAHLARFKVQPPFPQLDRPVERLEPNQHNRRTLATAKGREISYGTFRSRAEKRGWVRGSVVDAGGISSYYKLFPGASVEVSVETGGMFVGMDPIDTLTLGTTRFCTEGSIQRGSYVYDEPAENDPRLLTFGQVPPVVYSETVSDLKAIIAQKGDE